MSEVPLHASKDGCYQLVASFFRPIFLSLSLSPSRSSFADADHRIFVVVRPNHVRLRGGGMHVGTVRVGSNKGLSLTNTRCFPPCLRGYLTYKKKHHPP